MDKVIKALEKLGVEVGDRDALRVQVEALAGGQDADTLTAPQAAQIAEAIAASMGNGGLAVAGNSAPDVAGTQVRNKRGGRKGRTVDIKDALARAAGQSGEEISAFKAPLIQGIERWTDDEAESIVDAIAEAPNELVRKVGEKALAHAAELDHFREIGEKLSAVFGFVSP